MVGLMSPHPINNWDPTISSSLATLVIPAMAQTRFNAQDGIIHKPKGLIMNLTFLLDFRKKFENGGGWYVSTKQLPTLIRNCFISLAGLITILCCFVFAFFGGFDANTYIGILTTPNNNLAKINLSELLVTSQDLPPGWTIYAPPFSPAYGADDYIIPETESIGVVFLSDLKSDYGLVQKVYRSKSGFDPVGQAQANFSTLDRSFAFGSTPPGWKFKSLFADKSNFSCYTYSNES